VCSFLHTERKSYSHTSFDIKIDAAGVKGGSGHKDSTAEATSPLTLVCFQRLQSNAGAYQTSGLQRPILIVPHVD
jgi:hypothetical protein